MAAVAANPHSFSNINNPAWGMNGGQSLNAMNSDDVRGMFLPRKNIQRTNSSSSIASNSSTSSSSTLVSSNGSTNGSTNGAPAAANPGELNGGWPTATPRKRQQPKGPWPAARADGQPDLSRMAPGRQQMVGGLNGNSGLHQQSAYLQPQGQLGSQTAMSRPMMDPMAAGGQPVLYLLSLNGTFERKTIAVPFSPDTLRIGRQTNMKTVPTPVNGYFDSKVLSRQHAEIWADRQGKIWIRDIKSSNGTFVNGTRLSAENRESEPHELQTADHLELGIDIVSEDQKSVVHHKVAAKVEHAGFLSTSNSLLDMSFGELDPANGGMMPQVGGLQFRGRTGSQSSMGSSVRMPQATNMNPPVNNGMAAFQRGLWLNQPSTEAIVKKLHQEMRNARLQSQDLARTNAFINTLLSKEDVKNEPKPEGSTELQRSQMPNGNGAAPFRVDPKARFSDPPAPPPQQPLPEKPVAARPAAATDVPSLKRGATERPKSQPPTTSPIRPDHSEITQLQEALDSAKKEIDTQHAQMRDLEEMLLKEREARKTAEELARRLGDAVSSKRADETHKPNAQDSILEETFEPPIDPTTQSPESDLPAEDLTKDTSPPLPSVENAHASLFARIDMMAAEMKALRDQVEQFKVRAETAEVERDTARESLAEMIKKIRQRDEEEEAKTAARRARSLSRGRKSATPVSGGYPAGSAVDGASSPAVVSGPRDESLDGQPTLSRANTITPANGQLVKASPDQAALAQGVPYASMVGVVLLGMGLMAYLNGWQTQPHLDR